MRGVYDASIEITDLAAQRTLVYITAPSGRVVEVLSASVVSADPAVANQQLSALWMKVNALGTPTGTAITPAKHEDGDQAAASTVVGNVTASEPTYVANTGVGSRGFASLSGYLFGGAPEERLYIQGGQTYGLRLVKTATAYDAIVHVTFREIG